MSGSLQKSSELADSLTPGTAPGRGGEGGSPDLRAEEAGADEPGAGGAAGGGGSREARI